MTSESSSSLRGTGGAGEVSGLVRPGQTTDPGRRRRKANRTKRREESPPQPEADQEAETEVEDAQRDEDEPAGHEVDCLA